MARPRSEATQYLMKGIANTQYASMTERGISYPPGFQVTPFDQLISTLSTVLPPSLNDSQIASLVTTDNPYMRPDEFDRTALQAYRHALTGTIESMPLARSVYNIRLMLDQHVPLPSFKTDLERVTAILILDSCCDTLKYAREALGTEDKPFIGLNKIVDMMLLDIHELFPGELKQVFPGDDMQEIISAKSSFSHEKAQIIASKWLELEQANPSREKGSIFRPANLKYVMNTLYAYAGYTPGNPDPRGKANQALAGYSKDIGSFTVRVTMGESVDGISVCDLIDNGLDAAG